LIRLNTLPTYYYRPQLSEERPQPPRFGLPEDAKLYVCPQSLFKFHPDFDNALAALLRRDSKGLLVLVAGTHSHWNTLLRERIAAVAPDIVSRIVFLPRMPYAAFLHLLTIADAVLDPPYFGGGNTSYEAFAVGAPIVTWPGPFMRGRVTLGCYKKMGVSELIAGDAESYLDLAYRLANDPDWRAEMSTKILERCPVLYEESAAVHEVEDFFRAAVEAARRGERLTDWRPVC
jgi:predicted O-linked N-acetylglucosamine transferase (SPINDLY family)